MWCAMLPAVRSDNLGQEKQHTSQVEEIGTFSKLWLWTKYILHEFRSRNLTNKVHWHVTTLHLEKYSFGGLPKC
jgi:hypothetical protein